MTSYNTIIFNINDNTDPEYIQSIENMINELGDNRTVEGDYKLIEAAVYKDNIPLLEMFAQYFNFCIDRRDLFQYTDNIETIKWISNLEYDNSDILNQMYERIEKDNKKDFMFFAHNVKINRSEKQELLEMAKNKPYFKDIIKNISITR